MPPDTSIRLIVFGTGDFALPLFEHLCDLGHQVLALVTQPDRPQGRKQEIIPSLIKQAALRRGIAVLQPEQVNSPPSLEQIRHLGPDLLVTAAYGQILSGELLAIAPLGGINLHGSILPAYRGAAPIARAIQHGETVTGVTVIRMTPRIDAGGMIASLATPIGPDETAGELEHRLSILGAPLVARSIQSLVAGSAEIIPQDKSAVTKAPKLRKEDGTDRLVKIGDRHPQFGPSHAAVAACLDSLASSGSQSPRPPSADHSPRPSPWMLKARAGTVLEAHHDRLVVAAGTDAVRLLVIQVPGKKAIPSAEFLRGHHVRVGDRMGN